MSDAPDRPDPDPMDAFDVDKPIVLDLPLLSDDDLRAFVDDFISGRIFSMHHMSEHQMGNVAMVFMPLALGALAGYSENELKKIGTIYEELSKAGPRSINGMPCFFSFKILHMDDWKRAHAAILREEARRKEIEI